VLHSEGVEARCTREQPSSLSQGSWGFLRHAEVSPLLASASKFAVARPATDSRQRAILQTDSCALQIPHLLMFPQRATAHSNQARAHLTTDAHKSRVGKVQVQGSERSAERLLCSFSLC
jgi:hypothetical protein